MHITNHVCILALALSACQSNSDGATGWAVECGSEDDDLRTGVLGCWQLDAAVSSEEGLLVIRPEGSKSGARLYFFLGESLYYAVFDVRAEMQTLRGQVQLEFECLAGEHTQPCAELDFTLTCAHDRDTLGPCTSPTDTWTGYPFSWTRCGAQDCPRPPD